MKIRVSIQNVLRLLSTKIPCSDILTLNHFIAILSSIGLLPERFQNIAMIDPTCEYISFSKDKVWLSNIDKELCNCIQQKFQNMIHLGFNLKINPWQVESIYVNIIV